MSGDAVCVVLTSSGRDGQAIPPCQSGDGYQEYPFSVVVGEVGESPWIPPGLPRSLGAQAGQ